MKEKREIKGGGQGKSYEMCTFLPIIKLIIKLKSDLDIKGEAGIKLRLRKRM